LKQVDAVEETSIRQADEVGLPADPEFRAALVDYLEWGTLFAVINSLESDPSLPDNADAALGLGPTWRALERLILRRRGFCRVAFRV
jgi:hypothetical protein